MRSTHRSDQNFRAVPRAAVHRVREGSRLGLGLVHRLEEDTAGQEVVVCPWEDLLDPSLSAALRDLAAGRSTPAEAGSSGLAEALGRSSCHRTARHIPGRIRSRRSRRRSRSRNRPGTGRTAAGAARCTAADSLGRGDREDIVVSVAAVQVWQRQVRRRGVPVPRSRRCMPLFETLLGTASDVG